MLFWLAVACKTEREAAGLKHADIAVRMAGGTVASTTIYRFEKHETKPEDWDVTARAYAEALEVRPITLWLQALDLWQTQGLTRPLVDPPASLEPDD